jgi:hypothetical protein
MTRSFQRLLVVDVAAADATHCSLTCQFWSYPGRCRGEALKSDIVGRPVGRKAFLRTCDCMRDEAFTNRQPASIGEALRRLVDSIPVAPRIDEIRTG